MLLNQARSEIERETLHTKKKVKWLRYKMENNRLLQCTQKEFYERCTIEHVATYGKRDVQWHN